MPLHKHQFVWHGGISGGQSLEVTVRCTICDQKRLLTATYKDGQSTLKTFHRVLPAAK